MEIARALTINTEDCHPIIVAHLSGYCARLEVDKLKSEIEKQLADGKRYIILDLADLQFIDSAGIGALVQLSSECRNAGGELSVVEPRLPDTDRILTATSLRRTITFHPSQEEGLRVVREKYGLGPA